MQKQKRDLLLLFTAFLAGTSLYITTKNPLLGVVLPSIRGGWNSLSTGIWTFRQDPWRTRARLHLVFYIAAMFWQTAAAALASITLFFVAAHVADFQPDLTPFVVTMLVLVVGVLTSAVIGLGATLLAASKRIRLWINPMLKNDLITAFGQQDDVRPTPQRFNYAVFIVATSLAVPVLVAGSIILIAVTADGRNEVDPALGAIALLIFFGMPIGTIPIYFWLSRRIIAQSPREGWPFTTELPDSMPTGENDAVDS